METSESKSTARSTNGRSIPPAVVRLLTQIDQIDRIVGIGFCVVVGLVLVGYGIAYTVPTVGDWFVSWMSQSGLFPPAGGGSR